MEKKFFSLFNEKEIEIAPGKKIIPGSEFAESLNAKEVLELVKKDAIEYKKTITTECEKLKEKASLEGYEEGFKQWAEHILKLQSEIDNLRDEFTKVLAPVALAATQKIVGKTFELSNDIIYHIVENALRPVSQHKKITIYVNKNSLHSLEKNREKLKQVFESIESLSIRERDDLSEGSYVIETEGGIINGRLENLWTVLEKAFEKLLKKIPTQEKEKKDEESA